MDEKKKTWIHKDIVSSARGITISTCGSGVLICPRNLFPRKQRK